MARNDNSRMSVMFVGGLFVIALTMIAVIYVATRRPVVVVVPGPTAGIASAQSGVSSAASGEAMQSQPPHRFPRSRRYAWTRFQRNLELLIKATGLADREGLMAQLHKVVELALHIDRDEWSACYRLLFDGSIVCPVNEAGYIRRDKGSIIGDVSGFYQAFGWTAAESSGERPDHLLVELEFSAMLLVMSARAETREQADISETALADFARHHLNDWLPAFCSQLKLSTTYPLFVELADLLAVVWPAMISWHQWIVDPAPASSVGICEEPESPYECGAPDLVPLSTNPTP